jgi:hypothetical protein
VAITEQTAPIVASPARPSDLAFRLAGGISLLCVALHLVLVPVGGREMLAMSVPMLALALLCASCGVRVLRGSRSPLALTVMAATGVAMVLVHLGLEHGHADASGSMATMHHATAGATPLAPELVMHAGVTLAALQVALVALGVVAGRRRGRR